MTTIRSLVLVIAGLLSISVHTDAQTGTTILGTGLTGRPYVLESNVVIESIGLVEAIRSYEDTANPTWLTLYNHSLGGFWGAVLEDDGLVVALHDGWPGGYEILSLADPATPELYATVQGNVYTSGWLHDHALVLGEPAFFTVYEITDPTTPVFTAIRLLSDHPGDRWFSDVNGVLYCIDRGANIRGFDLATLTSPTDLGIATVEGSRIDAMLAGEGVLHLLVSVDRPGGVVDVELSTMRPDGAMAFTETGRILLGSGFDLSGITLERHGDLMLASLDNGTVHALGLADPTQPDPGFQLAHDGTHLEISSGQLFVVENDLVHIYDRTTHDTPPPLITTRRRLPRIVDLIGSGPMILAQHHDDRSVMTPIDVSNPRVPVLGEPFDLGPDVVLRYADGLGLTVISDDAFRLYDLSDPADPVLLATRQEPGATFSSARIRTGLVAIEGIGDRIGLYDITDPTNPVLAASVYDGFLQAIGRDVLICGVPRDLHIHDISDLSNPIWVRRLAFEVPQVLIRMAHGRAYVVTIGGTTSFDLHVVDLEDPSDPIKVSSQPVPHSVSLIAINNQRLYIQGYHTTSIYDLADPNHPILVGDFPSWGAAGLGLTFNGNITTSGGWLSCVRDDTADITGLPGAEIRGGTVLESAVPNPFNPRTTITFMVARREELGVTIHDLRGRTIAILAHTTFEPGRHAVTWFGRDDAGLPVASGVYLVRLHGTHTESSRTITLVK